MPDPQTENRPRILITEDDNVSFMLQSRIIKKLDCEVIRAFNGKEAVDMCSGRLPIALVIMDIHMPVMDGIEATRLINTIKNPPPVIVISSYNEPHIREKAVAAGCTGFISKPIQINELINTVSSYLF